MVLYILDLPICEKTKQPQKKKKTEKKDSWHKPAYQTKRAMWFRLCEKMVHIK